MSDRREQLLPRDEDTSAAPPPEAKTDVEPVRFLALFRYASSSDRMLLFFGVLGAVLQGLSGPALSFFMKDLFQSIFLPNDNGSMPPLATGPHNHRDHEVAKCLWIFLGLAGVSFVASFVSYFAFATVGDHMTLALKRQFFDQLLRKHVGWYDLHDATVMATRLTNDTYEFRQGVGEKFAQLIQGLVMSPASFVIAFIHDWRLTLMLFACIPIMGCTFGMAGAKMGKATAAQQEFYAFAGGIAERALSSVRTVAAFGGFDREIAKYDQQIDDAVSKGIRVGWCNGFAMGFAAVVSYGTFALGLYAGSWLVIRDYDNGCWESNPPFGTCFTGATMISTLFAVLYGGIGLSTMGPGLTTLAAARAGAARIYCVVDEAPAWEAEVGATLEHVEGRVNFEDVTFSYPTRLESRALVSATFAVAAGTTAAFVGPSGSGKTTVISLLQRFYDPAAGRICIDGHDIRSLSLLWLRTKMALVQQEPVLFSGTIRDNIGYGAAGAVPSGAVEAAAKSANAHTFITSFPKKYETEVGERGTQLSGGQKQRIAIARAMLRDPVVLLLDEATSALDTESERVVQKALDDVLKQKARTTMVVAHRLSTIRNADNIFVLDAGRIVEQGNHAQLMEQRGLYCQLVNLQEVSDGTGGDDRRAEQQPQLKAARSLSQRSSPARQRSRCTSDGSTAEGGDAAVENEAPPEDDEDVQVPASRLWSMQRSDLFFVSMALLCTVPVGAGRPLMGFLMSDTSTLFSAPPAQKIHGRWVGIMDTEHVRNEATKQCIEFALLGLLIFVCTTGQLGGFRVSGERLTRRIRHDTFTAMLRQEMAWFDARTSGHLANRLASEALLIKSFTGESLAAVLQLLMCLGSGFAIAFWTSWQLTLTTIGFVPFIMMGTAVMMKRFKQTNETGAGPLVSQAMGNIKTVAAFSLREQMLTKYLALLDEEGQIEHSKSMGTSFASAYNSGITFVMFGLVMFIGNIFVSKGITKPGDAMQVLFTVLFAASGAGIVSQWQSDKAKSKLALNHIFRTLDRVPEIDAYSTSGTQLEHVAGAIEFRHVQFRYPTRPDIVIFADFDLRIEPNTTVALCGPSGSGKSTTIALLQRFYDPQSGSVCLDGHDIRTLNLPWLRSRMALVQQEPVLFSGTILENIRYGRPGASDDECKSAAMSSNAHGFIQQMEKGYDTDVGDRGGQLSGGQKQRVAIARCMVRDPAVLLLDEATSALDTESERVVQEALDKLLAESRRTTLVIAHRLSTIMNSDIICVVYQGQIVEKGSHAELLSMNGHYKQLVARSQHHSS